MSAAINLGSSALSALRIILRPSGMRIFTLPEAIFRSVCAYSVSSISRIAGKVRYINPRLLSFISLLRARFEQSPSLIAQCLKISSSFNTSDLL